MFEIEISYAYTYYNPETFHPVTFRYHEVVELMDTIVCLHFHVTNIKWLDICHNMFGIWIDNRCVGYAKIRDVGPKTSDPGLDGEQ